MENNEISKKDLLDLMGISYGQLYRWKRKNLIPEEWFMKKSTYTGQETFFPREKILDRIDKIMNMKDDIMLDDMAEIFSPQLEKVFLTREQLIEKNIVTSIVLDLYEKEETMEKVQNKGYLDNEASSQSKTYTFEKILYLYILEKALESGEVSIEEVKSVLQTLKDHFREFNEKNCDIIIIRKFGVAICLIILSPNQICIENNAKLLMKINIGECIVKLKEDLNSYID
jgi:DNA-binding transcriptional MerR regulator